MSETEGSYKSLALGLITLFSLILTYIVSGTYLLLDKLLAAVLVLVAGYAVAAVSLMLVVRPNQRSGFTRLTNSNREMRRFTIGIMLNVLAIFLLFLGGSRILGLGDTIDPLFVVWGLVVSLFGYYEVALSMRTTSAQSLYSSKTP